MAHPTAAATAEESTGRPKGCRKPKGWPAEEPDDRRRPLILVAPTTVVVAVVVASAATFALPPMPLPPPPRLEAEEEVDWQEGEVQEELVDAASADDETSLPSLPRRSSLTRSMLVADLKSRSDILAMMSAVVAKRGLMPRRRLSTNYEGEMVCPTSRSASAVCFICCA